MRGVLWKFAASAIGGIGVSSPRLNILIYHGVGESLDPLGHCDVDRAQFERHLEVLRRAFIVLPLDDAVTRLHDGRLPPRAVCITFDDGYANNHDVALPLLEHHGLSATFFIATAYLDGGRMFNDIVIEAIRRSELPQLDLTDLGLGVLDIQGQEARIHALQTLLPQLKVMTLDTRDRLALDIAKAAGIEPGPSLMMTREQVKELARRGMQLGGHTRRHPILNSLPDAEAHAEIREGKLELESIIDAPVTMFAYPNGRPGIDYSRRHAGMVRSAGFRGAVSTARGCACQTHDPFQLPRFTPWDRGAERFLFRLAFSRRQSNAAEVA